MIHKFTVCVGVFLLFSTPAMAKTANEITSGWQKQLKQFKSLSYTANVSMTSPGSKLSKPVISLSKVNFFQDGAKYKFKTEITSIAGRKLPPSESFFGSAYDGQYYEEMSQSDKTMFLSKTKKLPPQHSSHQSVNPFLLQYAFVFAGSEEPRFAVLQDDKIWQRLSKRIQEVKPASRNKRKGSLLIIDSLSKDQKGSKQYYEVFVDDLTGIPLRWVLFTGKENHLITNELVVSDFKQFGQQKNSLVFPLKLTLTQPKGVTSPIVFSVKPEDLKVNKPVAQKFSFPKLPDTVMMDGD